MPPRKKFAIYIAFPAFWRIFGEIIGPAAAGPAGPVPTPLLWQTLVAHTCSSNTNYYAHLVCT